jgi:molybdopterin molybdotransferase
MTLPILEMKHLIGFSEALTLTLSTVTRMKTEFLPLDQLAGRVLSEDIHSTTDSPNLSTSLKDGYALVAADVENASDHNPMRLGLLGEAFAGRAAQVVVKPGWAVGVLTGAPLPDGADAVLPAELCRREAETVVCTGPTWPGSNILRRGADVKNGERIARRGELLTPPLVGLLASAGMAGARVYGRPRVAVIATGDEVVTPGYPLEPGRLYASNMIEIGAWLAVFGYRYTAEIVPDRAEELKSALLRHLRGWDVIVTSGGAWGSERDLVIGVLEALGWKGVYHRVRMGPGKALAFGMLGEVAVFCLPGGPPSNEMAFLQIVLPAIRAMAGHGSILFSTVLARTTEPIAGQLEWTTFVPAAILLDKEGFKAHPLKTGSRLQSMARKEGIIVVPEGRRSVDRSQTVKVQLVGMEPGRTHLPTIHASEDETNKRLFSQSL